MAVFIIAGLTIREAIRRKTLLGSAALGMLPVGLSLMLSVIRYRMEHNVSTGHMSLIQYAIQYPIARSVVTQLSLSAIKSLSALFAILLAGGSVSGEIERGLLAVVITRPIGRWQVLIGKWLGLNVVLMGSSLLWSVMVWFSISRQTGGTMFPVLHAGLYLMLFPLLVCTVTLSLSTFANRLLGTALALAVCAISWFDGILNGMSSMFEVSSLHTIAVALGLLMPQGYVGWWVEAAASGVVFSTQNARANWDSPEYLNKVLGPALHVPHLDAVYLTVYIVVVLAAGVAAFQRRDV